MRTAAYICIGLAVIGVFTLAGVLVNIGEENTATTVKGILYSLVGIAGFGGGGVLLWRLAQRRSTRTPKGPSSRY